jgi:hypothetical protein
MRRLTVVLSRGSTATIIDGGRRSFADFGEHLQKGMIDFRRLELPLLDSLLCDEIGNEAHLLGHSKDSGMVAVGVAMTNSGEVLHRGRGRLWEEEKYRSYPLRRDTYTPREAAASISSVHGKRSIRWLRPGHRAASRREDDDDLLLLFRSGTRPAGFETGCQAGPVRWAAAR